MFRQNIYLVVLLLSQISGIWCAAINGSFIESRIKMGTDVDIEEAKFVVSIRLIVDDLKEFGSGLECGGSLISEDVVLTAAHCFISDPVEMIYRTAKEYIVIIGGSNRKVLDNNTLIFDVEHFVTPHFTSDWENDIALVFLDDTVPKDHPTAQPVNLYYGELVDRVICETYGWGNDGNGVFPNILQVLEVPIMTYETCYEERFFEDHENIRPGMFCAGYLEGGRGTCDGDSGGPLVCGGVQVGINSWGIGCGAPLKPDVYTNVALYSAWILKHIALHGATLPTFVN